MKTKRKRKTCLLTQNLTSMPVELLSLNARFVKLVVPILLLCGNKIDKVWHVISNYTLHRETREGSLANT